MKAIAAFFFLGLVVLAFSTDSEETVNVNCPAEDGENATHLPHPTDCGAFFTCSSGVGFLTECPSGLHFNAELEVCDWPESANCVVEN